MKVILMNHTSNPDATVASAARMCYSNMGPEEIWKGLDQPRTQELVHKLKQMGHGSPFEHVTFTFAIEGVSRTLSHQLVRHRIASYSQKSQRYVSEGHFAFVTPPSIANNPQAREYFEWTMNKIDEMYRILEQKVPKEDARYVLPNACETQLVATFNARSLFNFFELRCCNRAQWEIRSLAKEMLKQVREVSPEVFYYAGARCDIDGTCPEGSKSCGRYKQKPGGNI